MDQQSFRKALGALKDSTTVGLAKINSGYKELDIAIVKATNHDEMLANEKHIRPIFDGISASKPRADVAYCISALAKRLAKTHNWAVAIKTLIVLHRALREVDATFLEELIHYNRGRTHMLNLSHFKDTSSTNAWEYSSWVRCYALYIEERLSCFRALKYDVETDHPRTSELDTDDLLEHLPALQQLLSRLLACLPEGAALRNSVIRYAFSIVASESSKIYHVINGCTLNLVDKFFEMQRHDALRALEIYRKAGFQAQRLSKFQELCKGLDLGRELHFVEIDQPPESFIAAMEEFVKVAPRILPVDPNLVDADRRLSAPKLIISIERQDLNYDNEKTKPIPVVSVPPESIAAAPVETPVPVQTQVTDLLGLDDFSQDLAKFEENNALALSIVSNNDPLNSASTLDLSNGQSGWELALVSAPSSIESAESKLAGGLDRLTLDSLYDAAISRKQNHNGSYHMGQVAPNPFEVSQFPQDPFYASNSVAPPTNVQMVAMAQQQAYMIQGQQQQQLTMMANNTNPFENPFGPSGASSYPTNTPYTSYM